MTDERITQEQRRKWLAEIRRTIFGMALMRRTEYAEIVERLGKDELSADDRAHIRRMVNGLHALSSVLTRTRKVDVQESKPVRVPYTISVDLRPEERHFADLFHEWCVERADAIGRPVGFVMQMPLRLVSSCIPAAPRAVLNDEPVRDLDDPDSIEAPPSTASQVRPSKELVNAAHAVASIDSKYTEFAKAVRELVHDRHQLLVFTFSRVTIGYLVARLKQDGFRVAELHGGIRHDDRQQIMKEFRQNAYDVIVANRVASEGLDFEFCSAIINYDLPWNPMEIEQRIGRIDRIGQRQEKIYVGTFHVPGTIETDIIAKVMDRIEVFRQSIGELEPIIGPELRQLRETIWDFSLSVEERAKRGIEIAIAAINREHDKKTVASASDVVLSGDFLDIEGLEDDLVKAGRYIGPRELAGLVVRWVRASLGTATVAGNQLRMRGNAALASQIDELVIGRVRTRAEVAVVSHAFRNEQDLVVSLDWEASREGGPDLLTALHPVVLGAKARPAHRTARYGAVSLSTRPGLPTGRYLTLLSEAIWTGHRSTREVWAESVSTETGQVVEVDVAANLWADLALGQVHEHAIEGIPEMRRMARRLVASMLDRRSDQEQQRTTENDAITQVKLDTRQVQYDNRVASIDRRLERLGPEQRRGRRLFESMRRKARFDYEADRVQIAERSHGSLELEHVACVVIDVWGSS